jgi:hypothetical protein
VAAVAEVGRSIGAGPDAIALDLDIRRGCCMQPNAMLSVSRDNISVTGATSANCERRREGHVHAAAVWQRGRATHGGADEVSVQLIITRARAEY